MAIINGTADDDFLIGTPADDTITAFGGNDLVNAGDGNDSVDGGEGHDNLRGEQGNDILLGGGGDDYLRGGPGDDLIDGGAGWDRVAFFTATSGIAVDLRIQGVAQDTTLGLDTLVGIEHASGTEFDDLIQGNDGDNWLWGENGNDTINAFGGNDLVEVGPGTVIADGGTGNDSLSVWANDAPLAGVTVSLLLQGGAQATGIGAMTLSGFENLSGSTGNDTLTGDNVGNVLAGDTGNDLLAGGAGNDVLYGDGRIIVDVHGTGTSGPITTYSDVAVIDPLLVDGDDILEGGVGDDLLDGGGGSDTASYALATGAMEIDLRFGFTSGPDGSDTLVSIENATGSEFDDLIVGSALGNVLRGLGGHDTILGYLGDDALHGDEGNDFLAGQQGNDSLHGGNGDDFFRGGTGNDLIEGGAGFDRTSFFTTGEIITSGVTVSLLLQGAPQDTGQGMDTLIGIEALSGTQYDDILTGDNALNWLVSSAGGNDQLFGMGGDDLIEVANGDHIADGGGGTDTISFLGLGTIPGGVGVSLALQGAAQDTGQGSMTLSGFENLSGSTFDDQLAGDGADNLLGGHDGNDTLSGGAGNDTLYGDGGVVSIVAAGGFTGGAPTTVVDLGSGGNDVLDGGLGDDILNGGAGIDTASYASAIGDVQVFLTAGGGVSEGSAGDDILIGIENVVGSAHNDNILGNALDNLLDGGDGHDLLRGFAGNDTLLGGHGDDFLNGGLGDDLLNGGAGWDRVAYSTGATAGVTVDLNIVAIAQDTGLQGMDTLTGIEHVSGTRFNDVLTGDGGDNWIWGGSDSSGITGNDIISAGGGNDLVEIGTGTHTLAGGLGIDTWSLYGNEVDITAAGVTASLALQGAAQDTEQGMMNASGFENLSGSIYADALTGDGNNNLLAGDEGDDTLSGGDGADTLLGDGRVMIDNHETGGSGPIVTTADIASLGEPVGNDVLIGGKGNDILNGGGGDDLLTGGQGEDNFVFGPASGDDHVTDFAKKDIISLQGVAGVDDFSDLTIVNVGGSAVISWGTGDSVTLDGYKASKLSAADFSFGASAPLTAFAAMPEELHISHADLWML